MEKEKEKSIVDIFIDAYADNPIKEEIKHDAYEDKKKQVLATYHKLAGWSDDADIRTSCRCNVTLDQLHEWLQEDNASEAEHLEECAESTTELEESSTAERKSLKLGGEATDDLARGRGIASIKDKDERDAAVAALKAGRKDLVDKEFIGDRKNLHIENDLDKKAIKMQRAVAKESSDDDVDATYVINEAQAQALIGTQETFNESAHQETSIDNGVSCPMIDSQTLATMQDDDNI